MKNIIDFVSLADAAVIPGKCDPSFGDIGILFDELFDDAADLMRLEALSLDSIFQHYDIETVLDCSCGTGIQALGLAKLGYIISASDISKKMLQILEKKANEAKLAVKTRRANFCNLSPWKRDKFDAVISGGNSVSVLNSFSEIDQMLKSMKSVTCPGGIVVIGARDYSVLRKNEDVILPRKYHIRDSTPEWIFDLRLFGKKRVRVINVFLSPSENRWRIKSFTKSYLYIPAEKLVFHMKKIGLLNVRVLDVDGYKPYSGGEWYLAIGEKKS